MTLPTFEEHAGHINRVRGKIGIFIWFLQHTTDEETVIPSAEFERLLGLRGTDVRFMVSLLREYKAPIASTGKGYFWANQYIQLLSTMDHIRGRISRMQTVLEGLEWAKIDWTFDDFPVELE